MILSNERVSKFTFTKLNDWQDQLSLQTIFSVSELEELLADTKRMGKNVIALKTPVESITDDGLHATVRLTANTSKDGKKTYEPSVPTYFNFLKWALKK